MAHVREILLPRTSQPQEATDVNPASPFLTGSAGDFWVPTQGYQGAISGVPTSDVRGGLPATIGREGFGFTVSGQTINAAPSVGKGLDVGRGFGRSASQITLVALFESFDAPSSSGYGALVGDDVVQLQYHHGSAPFLNTMVVRAGSGAYAKAAFSTPAANTPVLWIGTYDGSTVQAYTNGVLTASDASVSGSLYATGSNNLILGTRPDGYTWNGRIYFAGAQQRAWSAEEVAYWSQRIWENFAPKTILVPVSAGGGGISATLTQTLADATVTSASTLALKGTVSQNLANATTTATGTLALKGTTTQTLADATLVAAGAVALKGAVAQTLANATLAATGSLQATGSGVLSATLADATVASTGTVALKAAVAQTLADATLSAAGKVAIAGTTTQTLAPATLASTSTVALKATTSQTLADATLTASGVLAVTGSGVLAQTLADATVTASAKIALQAVASKTLAEATLASTGVLPIVGTTAQTLADATLSAQGTAQTVTTGSVTVTLGNATVVAAAKLAIAAYAAPTLADATVVATATAQYGDITGAVAQTLESATCTATATVLIKGSAAITLGDCTIVASNVPTIFTDSEWWKYEVQVQDMRYSVPPQPMTFEIER